MPSYFVLGTGISYRPENLARIPGGVMMAPAKNDVHQAAREGYQAGLCLVPTAKDGSKRPALSSWQEFKTRRPSVDEMRAFHWAAQAGLGMIAGPVSGYRECWDFDDAEVYDAFVDAAKGCGLADTVGRIIEGYCDRTPAGGRRWIVQYPASVEWRDVTLARRPGRAGEPPVKTLIEMPLHAIVAPSGGGIHPSGKPYVRVSGGFDTITSYTAEERENLITLARSFDEMPRIPHEERTARLHPTNGELRPGDDYAQRTAWAEILEPHGWTRVGQRGEVTSWRRPGKAFGISATTNVANSDLLYVFTSSTVFEQERSYSKFAAYAVLNHDRDFSAAARALARQQYGSPRSQPNSGGTSAEQGPGDSSSRLGPMVVCVADVQSERVSWLWRRRLARGKLTLLMGDPGVGKSFITVDATSRITTGGAWPDGGGIDQPGNVLFLAVEDGIGDTIRPRLERAGSDLSRVFVLTTIRDEAGERMPDLERDMGALEQKIAELHPALVVVDPISSYLGKSDSYKDSEMRRVLNPLVVIAERHKVAIVALVHMTKGSKDAKALYRAVGSIAFAGLARVVLAAGADPEHPSRCYLMPVKQNNCKEAPTLAYTLQGDPDDEDATARLVWEVGPVEGVRADVILGTGVSASELEQQQDAAEFLQQLLDEDGRMRSDEVYKAGKANGYSASTLNRAKRRAGVRSRREGFRGAWYWELESKIVTKATTYRDLTTFGENRAVSPAESTPSSKIVTNPGLTIFGAEDDDPEVGLV